MKETPRAFAARTGRAYVPDPGLRALGAPAGDDDPVPTLFRYPGPRALLAAMDGRPVPLAPGPLVYLAEVPDVAEPVAARTFGVIAVLEPLALGVVATDAPGIWRGWATRPVSAVWVPPSAFDAAADWDAWATAEAVMAGLPGYAEQLAAHRDALSAYVEELAALARRGAPGPDVPWVEVPAARRRALLGDVAGRWTR